MLIDDVYARWTPRSAYKALKQGGVPAASFNPTKICGWRDLETMQIYIRLAGIEVQGVTDGLKLLPETEIMGKVVNLFGE